MSYFTYLLASKKFWNLLKVKLVINNMQFIVLYLINQIPWKYSVALRAEFQKSDNKYPLKSKLARY